LLEKRKYFNRMLLEAEGARWIDGSGRLLRCSGTRTKENGYHMMALILFAIIKYTIWIWKQ
jgi:hypothetical protein